MAEDVAPRRRIDAVVDLLVCPHGDGDLERRGAALVCTAAGHSFDIARQGYVSLLAGAAPTSADTTAMVTARERMLDAGHLSALTDTLVPLVDELTRHTERAVIVDAGGGTGHHATAMLRALDARRKASPGDASTGPVGVVLDASAAAVRRAARAHPGLGAVRADVWRRWPLRDRIADVVVHVLAPRNVDEAMRVLRRTGHLVVVGPRPEHLRGLVDALDLVGVAPDRDERLRRQLDGAAVAVGSVDVTDHLVLDLDGVVDLAVSGPTGAHADAAEIERRARRHATTFEVTVALRCSWFSRLDRDADRPSPSAPNLPDAEARGRGS